MGGVEARNGHNAGLHRTFGQFKSLLVFLNSCCLRPSVQAEVYDYPVVAFPLCCAEQILDTEKNLSSGYPTRAVEVNYQRLTAFI